MQSEKAEERKIRANVGQGDIRPEQPMQICLSHGQSVCGHMHVMSVVHVRARERNQEKISRKAPCTVHVTDCGRASERARGSETRGSFPQFPARCQISYSLDPVIKLIRHVSIHEEPWGARNLSIPVAGISFCGVGFGGVSVRGSFSASLSLSLTLRLPHLNSTNQSITRSSRPQSSLARATKLPLP